MLKWRSIKKIIHKISQALQVILLAPVKLPGKVLNVIKYVALGLGIVEKVIDLDEPKQEESHEEE